MGDAVSSDSLPEPAASEPHVRPGNGHVRSADAGRRGRLHARLQPRGHRHAGEEIPDFGGRVSAEDPRCPARARPAHRARNGNAQPQAPLVAALVAFPTHPQVIRPEILGFRRRRRAARQLARSVLGRAGIRRRAGLRSDRDGSDRQPESSLRNEKGFRRQSHGRCRREDRRRRRDPGSGRERHARLLQRGGRNRAGVRRRMVPYRRHR